MRTDKCDYCGELGVLGPEIRTYQFAKPNGKSSTRSLHASDGGRSCYDDYYAKYLAWRDEQTKKVANG
jgi:hypothetical protein